MRFQGVLVLLHCWLLGEGIWGLHTSLQSSSRPRRAVGPHFSEQRTRWSAPARSQGGGPAAAARGNPSNPYAGCIVEYVSAKGSKRIALISKRSGPMLEALNDARNSFSIQQKKVTYTIHGKFEFGDLLRLNELLEEMRPNTVERLWEGLVGDMGEITSEEMAAPSPPAPTSSSSSSPTISSRVLSTKLFGTADPMRLFATFRLMSTHGSVFFKPLPPPAASQGGEQLEPGTVLYAALPPATVQANLRDRAALRELKQRYKKMQASKAEAVALSFAKKDGSRGGDEGSLGAVAGAGAGTLPAGMLSPEMPERMLQVLNSYGEGLKHLVIKTHPWVVGGWAKRAFDEDLANKGRELLELLDLAPSAKNAKKILDFTGIWPQHSNVEKFVMNIRDRFPQEVLDEAEYLLNNQESVIDQDERIRRDLRGLNTYAIDREGASEVDDAVSLEMLEDGREKLWVHIADVSRWIRPGSPLSIEAERRMLSVYLPDEKIPMFPEALSTELLSLGARVDSYALSCGVTLTPTGEVEAYEVCPSLVRVSRRLSYTQLDAILGAAEEEGEGEGAKATAGAGAEGGPSVQFAPDEAEAEAEAEAEVGTEADASAQAGAEGSSGALDLAALITGSPSSSSSSSSSSSAAQRSRKAPRRAVDPTMRHELQRLNHWARVRHAHRQRSGALDQFLRHKTELYLSVKRDPKLGKYSVTGHTTWANATSMSLVSEYMILMCQTVGGLCERIQAPVWFKVQQPEPPLSAQDVELMQGESLFLRSARLMRHLRTANDSKVPGPHCTSGSVAYVQCTSPIRRYHDLYNHYRLKAAMHAASMAEDLASLANEEAGITRLDSMASEEERLGTINAIRLVTRHREQYWLGQYMERQLAVVPRVQFDCLISASLGPFSARANDPEWAPVSTPALAPASGSGSGSGSGSSPVPTPPPSDTDTDTAATAVEGFLCEALILQLGSFTRYPLFHLASSAALKPGDLVRCHLYRRYTNPPSYLLLPIDVSPEQLPAAIIAQLSRRKGKGGSTYGGDEDEDD